VFSTTYKLSLHYAGCSSGLQSIPVLNAEGRGRSEVGLCQVAIGSFGAGISFFPEYVGLPVSFIQYFIVILLLSEGQAGEEWDPSNKAIHCFIYSHVCSEPTNAHRNI
jgi:hypothetical protein